MFRQKLASITRRSQHGLLAALFICTQVIFPLSFIAKASADAADSIPASATGNVVVNPDGTVTLTVNGAWQWTTHNTDCNTDRYAVGWAVDWNDSAEPGNYVGTVNSTNVDTGVRVVAGGLNATDNLVHTAASPPRCGVYGSHTSPAGNYNTGTWGPLSHTYPAGTTSFNTCVVTYDVHLADEKDPSSGPKSGDLVAGDPSSSTTGNTGNKDNSVEDNKNTPLGSGCFSATIQNLVVVKHVINDNGGTKSASDFTMQVNAVNPSQTSFPGSESGTTVQVGVGAYSVDEAATAGYTESLGPGCSGTIAAGETKVCVITNNDNPPTGSITINKDAVPNSSQDFNFTATGSGVSNFALDDDNDPTLSNTKTFSSLAAGTYSFTESPTSGWDFDNITCSQGAVVQKNGATVTITLADAQNVSCTYTNRERGTLTVHKVTNPANDPTGFPVTASTSNGNIAGNATQTVSTGQDVTYDVSQGTYDVSEDLSNTPGWSQASNTCSGVVVSANNLNPTCTITNTKLAKLKIVKSTNPSSSSQAFSFGASGPSITQANSAFELDTNNSDNTLPNNVQYTDLTPGTYTVTETEPSNWALTGLACTGITYSWDGNTHTLSLNVPAGADITCTFTNTQLVSINGTKYEVNANGTSVTALPNWTIYLLSNNQVVGTTTTDGSGNYSFTGFFPGSYTVAEQQQNGWTQIYSPSGITLSAGDTSSANNFGNFQNGSISGSKFDDLNGNHLWDNGEPGLSGWVITLYDNGGSGAMLNHQVAQTTTANDGSYSFSDLPPNNYKLCETMKSGWSQTFPTTNGGCQLVTVALSGHDYSNINFGNQGRGSITVVKNVDSDGNGTVDQHDVTNWNWNINGSGHYNTGSHNTRSVAADNYTVSEVQKDGYHVTASSCTGETGEPLSTSQAITVSPGENVVCTFTNTRDTGFVTVNKVINPSNDNGKFNLHIDGQTDDTAFNQGNGGTTGSVRVVTGQYQVSESAGSHTDMNDYNSVYSCDNSVHGTGTHTPNFTVTNGQHVICTFTNTRYASLTVVKHADPNSSQNFHFHFGEVCDYDHSDGTWNPQTENDWNWNNQDGDHDTDDQNNCASSSFTLQDPGGRDSNSKDNKTFNQLLPGSYFVTEDPTYGWDLTNIQCGEGVHFFRVGSKIYVTIEAGAHVTCTFTNTERSSITIVKDAEPNSNQAFNFKLHGLDDHNTYFSLVDSGTPLSHNHKSFDNIKPGYYSVEEFKTQGWDLSKVICTGGRQTWNFADTEYIHLQPGEHITCTFTNQERGSIVVTKYNDYNLNGLYEPNGNPAEPALPGWDITLDRSDQVTGQDGTTTFTNVKPGYHKLGEVQQTGWNLSNIYCDDENGDHVGITLNGNNYYVDVDPDATVHCYIGNYQNPQLQITKSNNRPNPTVDGDIVTYTITVTVPNDSGAVFNTTVTDLPPANFTYVPGSWTADSSLRGDLKAGDITGEPTYGSPGIWHLGTMLPGEIVTLTYKALIGLGVTNGTYPDLAFTTGFSSPFLSGAPNVTGGCTNSSCLNSIGNPFVTTAVTVTSITPGTNFTAGQALGAELLVNTGTSLLWVEFVLPPLLVTGVYITRRATHYQEKGGK